MEVTMRLYKPVPEKEQRAVEMSMRKAVTKLEYQHFQALWLRIRFGMKTDEIATAQGVHQGTVKRIHAHFLQGGIEATVPQARGGRRRENISPEAEKDLLRGFTERAQRGDVIITREIWQAYEQQVGHAVPCSTISRLLQRHHWRKIVPGRVHPEANIALQEEFKKNSRMLSEKRGET
jgi:transposase